MRIIKSINDLSISTVAKKIINVAIIYVNNKSILLDKNENGIYKLISKEKTTSESDSEALCEMLEKYSITTDAKLYKPYGKYIEKIIVSEEACSIQTYYYLYTGSIEGIKLTKLDDALHANNMLNKVNSNHMLIKQINVLEDIKKHLF